MNNPEFYFTIQTKKKQMFHIKLVGAINKLNNLFNPDSDPGALCLEYLKINASGIVHYFKKTLQTDSEIEKYLSQTLSKVFFSRKYSILYKNSHDRFLMDSDIKVFLEMAGKAGWDAVHDMADIYKHYPNKKTPNWDEITVKNYQD